MKRRGQLTHDDRGVSFNVGYVITVAITAILIVGLVTGIGNVIDRQQNRAVSHQVDVIGDQAAASVMATDRLGEVGAGTNVTVTRQLPSEVVGTPYSIRLVNASGGGLVIVEALDGQYTAEVPISTRADIHETIIAGADSYEIVHTYDPGTEERTVRIQPTGQPPTGFSTDDAYFATIINNISPDPATEGDTVTVEATVTNTGDEAAAQSVQLNINGFGEVDDESVFLDPGDSTTVTLDWDSAVRTGSFEGAVIETEDATAFRTFVVQVNS